MKKINKRIWIIVIGVGLVLVAIIFSLAISKKQNKLSSMCKRAGCSNQLCVASDSIEVITTCEWKAKYGCYQKAKCELQKDGQCGFTKDEELDKCIGKLIPRIVK